MTADTLITLDKLTYGGEAMGRLTDGRAVFVPFALPGETVRVRLTEEKRGFVRARLLQVESPAPERIAPKCRHFRVCGGCHYQHLPYADQCTAKTEILRDQLERIGKFENPPVDPIEASPNPWNYRNQLQFHLTAEGALAYVDASSEALMPVKECHLPEPALEALWPQLAFEPGMDLARVALRAGADDDLMLVLESEALELPEMELEAGISVVHLAAGDAVVMAGDDHIQMRVLARDFRVSADSFFQVNTPMAERMVAHVLELLPEAIDTLLDVYCGVGLFSAFLAPRCQRLIGIEVSASACEDFAFNLDEFDHVELYEATAAKVLPSLQLEPDAILVDPPRAGLDRRAMDALLALGPEVLVYVSCDPSTLARDARRLVEGGYRLTRVTPFDLFPQTYHIESISLFTR